MAAVLTWVGHHWGVLFFLWFLGFFGAVRDFVLDTLAVITGHPRPAREIEWDDEDDGEEDAIEPPATARERIKAYRESSEPAAVAEKKPGPCVHRNVSPIVSLTDEVVGWLCKTCTKRLPPDWAVREEDL